MAVLLLRFSAPMQSWGDSSRFSRRLTRREPTKSGVVGLLASALGRTREEPVEDLAQLELAIRVDQRGELLRDFQTERPEGKKPLPLSHRYYLSDAKFLVALGGPLGLLSEVEEALGSPRWPLYLGRRSCPPDMPLAMGLIEDCDDPREPLMTAPWIASDRYRRSHSSDELELVCDGRDGEQCESQADYPLSYSLTGRRYSCRPVTRIRIPNPEGDGKGFGSAPAAQRRVIPDHDPMSAL